MSKSVTPENSTLACPSWCPTTGDHDVHQRQSVIVDPESSLTSYVVSICAFPGGPRVCVYNVGAAYPETSTWREVWEVPSFAALLLSLGANELAGLVRQAAEVAGGGEIR